MGKVREALRALLEERRLAVKRIEQIDHEIADVRTELAAPLPLASPSPASHGVATPASSVTIRACRKAPEASAKRHDREASREQCRKDVLAVLANGPLSAQGVAAKLSWPKHVVTVELFELRAQGRVEKNGKTGRWVRWSLTSGRQAPAKRRAVVDDGLETVWPLTADPKAPVRALHEAHQ